MAQQTLSDARIVDSVLTTIARGYSQPGQFVGQFLFPSVSVAQRGGRVMVFGEEEFKLYNTIRAPGAKTGRVQFAYGSTTYSLVDHSLEAIIPIELIQETANGPGIDRQAAAVRKVQAIMALEKEYQAATLARNAAFYGTNTVTLSGSSQWSDPASDPISDVSNWAEAIRAKIGRTPNEMVFGRSVFRALKVHPKIIARIQYTGRDVPSLELLASLFEMDNIRVADAVYQNDTDTGTFRDVWGKDVILAYANGAAGRDMGDPSFGYTYQLDIYPDVEEPYFERNHKSWVAPVTDAYQAQLVGPSAGFLAKNVVS